MASTKLSRLPSTTGNRRTFTISAWVKRSSLGSRQAIFAAADTGTVGAGGGVLRFESDDKLRIVFGGGVDGNIFSSRVFRDTSAWYHIVWRIDTTQSTASDRAKIWVNGEEETLSFSTNMSQNYDTAFNYASTNQYTHFGAARDAGSQGDANTHYLDGSMAHIHLTDGQAYSASDFAETDSTTNIWKPKTAPSLTYGTNGVFLKMENSGSMGTDSSGNANNFTVNGTLTQTIDTPSNVFCTLNPLDGNASGNGGGANCVLSNGNTRSDSRYGAGEFPLIRGNLYVSKGKYYWEAKVDTTGIGLGAGVRSQSANGGDFRGGESFYGQGFSGHSSGASLQKYDNSGTIALSTDVSNGGGVIGYALNLDDGEFSIYYNGTLEATDTTLPSDNSEFLTPVAGGTNSASNSWSPISYNFGNGYFGTTAVSSANADDNGIGAFEYAPPTGFLALCTKNINSQEYS